MNSSLADDPSLNRKIPVEWRVALVVSVGLHLFLFIAVSAFTGFDYSSRKMPAVIDVDLMWMSAPPAAKKTDSKRKKSRLVKKKSHRKIKKTTRKKKVGLRNKKKKKKIIKKKVANSKDIINDAIKRLQKDLDKTRPDPLAERMKQLEKEAELDKRDLIDSNSSDKQVADNSGRELTLIDRYVSYVKVAVQENWAFAETLAGNGSKLETRIFIKVMPNGEIKGIRIIKKSGNNYMDSAASMAVVKTSPVEPFPAGITRKYIEIDLGFSPQ